MDNNYNPYDILKAEEVKDLLDSAIARIPLNKKNSSRELITKAVLSHATGVTNFVGVGLAKILEIGNDYNLQQLQREQITYLKNHPEDLERQLRFNLIITTLILENTFYIKTKMDFMGSAARFIRNWVKTRSFTEGMVETMVQSHEREEGEKWTVLKSPICLLMNSCFLNKNISSDRRDRCLLDLIRSGEKTGSITELCLYQFDGSFLNGTIREYLANSFNELVGYSERCHKEIPQLSQLKDKCVDLKDQWIEELNKTVEESDKFYRDEIAGWATEFPARDGSKNYAMVIRGLSDRTGIPEDQLGPESNIEDLHLSPEQLHDLASGFNEEKGFLIDDIYLLRFTTAGQIVSFWEAYDKHGALHVTP